VKEHPCYSSDAHHKFARIHLPVAPKCNIGCNFCVRKFNCANESRPGVTSKLVTPKEAIELVRATVKADPNLRVVGISGPGDPLTSDATFETLRFVKMEFPHLTRCISTNGLLLPEKICALKDLGVNTLTVTINAVDPAVGEQIYSFVNYTGETLYGKEAFEVLSKNQLTGLSLAAELGMAVKVNTVFIPGINSNHIIEVARAVQKRGAYIMNVMPLIPMGNFAHIPAPSLKEVHMVRNVCGEILVQFHKCVQCRADAVGIPGKEVGGN
jgi:nitrogen fixation protein NifB